MHHIRRPWLLVLTAGLSLGVACSSGSPSGTPEKTASTTQAATAVFPKATVDQLLSTGDFNDALAASLAFLQNSPNDCSANYAALIASTMLVIDSINTYVLPSERSGPPPPAVNQQLGQLYGARLTEGLQTAQQVTSLGCEYNLATLPVSIGDVPSDPVVKGEVRGTWTARTGALLGAAHAALLWDLEVAAAPQPTPPTPTGQTNPELPQLLAIMKDFLLLYEAELFTQPTNPLQLRGGWFDRNGDLLPDAPDELLIDLFEPGTFKRVFDFSGAEFVPGQALPKVPLTPTWALPPAQCGYTAYHIDDLATGEQIGSADGVTLSPDGKKAAIPVLTGFNHFQVETLNLDGTNTTCITCNQPGNNDGARWRPQGDVILFVSTRDHPNAIGGDGAGFGQELYAMRPDGSNATRLTVSNLWATNYHANWSRDGQHIVWGRTQDRTWDVMVADFVSDAFGMRLVNQRRLVHDTTWWETHGFTADETSVITTNTRAGFLSTDIYAINVFTGERKRLTDNMTWDEHAHVSWDGRKMAWISSRYQPASVAALNDGSLTPVWDFFWIVPGIFFEFANAPIGYTTELTMMDTDGNNLQQLTSDNQVVADNEWSFDNRRIIFRQTDGAANTTRIRLLTFDDCK